MRGKRLNKELGLLGVYALATGATLSSGFFLLPGLAAVEAGPAVVLSYVIAAIPLIPAMLCKIELSTAMPRAGGTYYFLDRSLGPMMGTIGGLGIWLTLMLKTAFALIGIGAYLGLFVENLSVVPLALCLTLLFGAINYLGARESGRLQIGLVALLLALLIWFVAAGAPHVELTYFEGFFRKGSDNIISTAGYVYISYIGITKIASVSEEVKDPEKNLPRGVLLACLTAFVVYGVGTPIIVGLVPPEVLYGGDSPDLTPVATAARVFAGHTGMIVMSIAAILAFSSVANAGILSSSRFPLAMSRDHLMPRLFRRINKRGVPVPSVAVTVVIVALTVVFLDPEKIAKLAGAFQLLMFALLCVAVIIMRESKIDSYDPSYKTPYYPWLPIIGVLAPMWIIAEMGLLPQLFTVALIIVGYLWYRHYARDSVRREGAIYHVFENLGRRRYAGLDPELREILKEKGLRETDPFDEVIVRANVIDLEEADSFDEVTGRAATLLAKHVNADPQRIHDGLIEGSRIGATPVSRGAALPHMRLKGVFEPQLVLVRIRKGIAVSADSDIWGEHRPDAPLHAIFFLLSPESDPRQHLRILAQIAGCIDAAGFIPAWLEATHEQDLKEIMLRDERFISMRLARGTPSEQLVGLEIRQLDLPEDALVTMVRRGNEIIIPKGATELALGDQITLIGNVDAIRNLKSRFRNLG